jgi:hypothetical protein
MRSEHEQPSSRTAYAEIANRAESSASLMPEGLLEGYSQADIANLLTFVLGPAPTK